MKYNSLYGKIFNYEEEYSKRDLIRLEGMDYDTSIFKIPKIYKYAIDLMFKHHTLTYSDFSGLARFKKLISDYENFLAEIKNKENFVFIGSGVSNLVYPTIEAILKLGTNKNRRKIITFEPDYPIFHTCIKQLNAKVLSIKGKRENNFLVNFNGIKKIMRNNKDQVCAIIFSYPNNPTCNFQDKIFFKKLIQICQKNNIFIVSDEIYRDTLYNKDNYINIAKLNGSYKNFIRLYGWSKDRPGMTGMRCGYIIGDKILESHIFNNQVIRNFSGNIIAEYVFMIDIALRYYKLTGTKFIDLKYFPQKLIDEYYKIIQSNADRQIKFNKNILSVIKNNKNIIDYIEPKCGNSILIKYKDNLNAKKFNREMIKKGLAIYPCDCFSFPDIAGCWGRICITKKLNYLINGINKI
ncbi:MAG: pyridoxal phosphate-dependent aminotransferase [Candidatus Peribacteria bacterium]|jgi:aspartate/methionine/tyrosine aminotransferase|nr:pyridoxal phosphate-dependent aminotransferase [Candidatus Peribacteria bacterium]